MWQICDFNIFLRLTPQLIASNYVANDIYVDCGIVITRDSMRLKCKWIAAIYELCGIVNTRDQCGDM